MEASFSLIALQKYESACEDQILGEVFNECKRTCVPININAKVNATECWGGNELHIDLCVQRSANAKFAKKPSLAYLSENSWDL